jgi:hypothetical protein
MWATFMQQFPAREPVFYALNVSQLTVNEHKNIWSHMQEES